MLPPFPPTSAGSADADAAENTHEDTDINEDADAVADTYTDAVAFADTDSSSL